MSPSPASPARVPGTAPAFLGMVFATFGEAAMLAGAVMPCVTREIGMSTLGTLILGVVSASATRSYFPSVFRRLLGYDDTVSPLLSPCHSF